MNGWVRTASGLWHQVDHDARAGTARLLCNGTVVAVDAADVIDYRWWPEWGSGCQHVACITIRSG